MFPSFVWHRVCPVKSGERNSLVIWNLGWPFLIKENMKKKKQKLENKKQEKLEDVLR